MIKELWHEWVLKSKRTIMYTLFSTMTSETTIISNEYDIENSVLLMNYFFQVPGLRSNKSGYTSSRPASISNIITNFEKSEKEL